MSISDIYNIILGIVVAFAFVVMLYRISRAYMASSNSGAQEKLEDRGKQYLSIVVDAALFVTIALAARALLGFVSSVFQGEVGLM